MAAAPNPGVAGRPAGPGTAGSDSVEGVPDVELSSALLYQIIAAEIAVQRGDGGAAFATLLKTAQETRDPRLARRAAEIAIAARAAPQALEATTLWRELAPESTEAVQAHAALLVAAGRYDEAAPMYAAQLSHAGDPLAELGRVQQILAKAQDPARAFALYEKLAKPYRDDPQTGFDVRLMLAQAAFRADLPARAVEESRAALALRPDSERAAMLTAQLLVSGDPQGAQATGDATAAVNPGRRQAIEQLRTFLGSHADARATRGLYARLLVADNQLPAAQSEFETLVKGDARDADSLYALGVLALQQERRPAARGYFERYLAVLAASPGGATALSDQGDTATDAPPGLGQRDPTPAWLNLARIAEDEKQYDKALGWLQKAEGAGTDTFNARVRRAIVLGKMKRVDEGRTVLTTSTATSDDENSQLVLAEGQLLRDAGRYKESFDLLDRAAGERPKDAAVLYDTAMAAEKVDRLDAMERNLRQVIALRPEYAHAYNALGYTLADRNVRLDEARTLIEKARTLAPDDAFILDSEGWLYFRLGQFPKARELLDRAWRMRPEADVAAHLGEVLWVLGERDAARKVWRDGHEKEPANEGLQATLKRLKVKL